MSCSPVFSETNAEYGFFLRTILKYIEYLGPVALGCVIHVLFSTNLEVLVLVLVEEEDLFIVQSLSSMNHQTIWF